MKGLKEYIAKHGKHFTEELASDVTERKWNPSKIQNAAQKRVYYNVTGSTSGDMVYLMDMFHCYPSGQHSHGKCVSLMLSWMGDYHKTGSPFCIWLTMMTVNKEEFDFTPYI